MTNGSNGHGVPGLWRSLLISASFPLAVIAISFWLTIQFDKLLAQHADVQRVYRQQAVVAKLISDLKDAETGQRGFVITGDVDFLEPYEGGRREIGRALQSLDDTFATEGRTVRAHVGNLKRLVPLKLAEMQRVLDIRNQQGPVLAAAAVSEGRGKRLMDQIRDEAGAIERYQERELGAKSAAATQNVDRSKIIYAAAVILITAICVLSALYLWINRRARHAATTEAANASQRQAAIFNSALNAIILINPSGSIEVLNPAAERLFGYPATDLLRRDISLIADIAPGEGPFLSRLGCGEDGLAEPFRPLLQARRSNGETVPVEVALGLMPLEDGMHVVAVFGDVTEREKVEQIKDQFLSTVSHELRTPLTSIVGSLGLLKAGVADELSPQAHRLVEIAENNANRLIRIVNDILDAEKLQSGQMEFDLALLDLREVVALASSGMSGLAATKEIAIDIKQPETAITVRGDKERLVQVVNNLLSNAIKFSPSGSRIDLSVIEEGKEARILVADRGPGIPDELRTRLFGRFAQAAGSSHSGGSGTGLGLSISRQIVQHHGGDIDFADAEGGGTVFSFGLPLWSAYLAQGELNGALLLLVYTDRAEAEILTANFAPRQIRVDVVDSIAEALRAVRQRRYLAMIVDFQFTDGDAPAIIRAVRADPKGRTLPIIGIASEATPVNAGDTAAIDITDWLHKPLIEEQLDDAVAGAIARAAVEMPLVLHVDDDADTLEITAASLAGIARVAQAPDLSTARRFLSENRPDILILDIALPDGSGLDLVSELAGSDNAGTPIVIYTAQDGGRDLREVEAVLTKSKKSLPNLVETILAIRERQEASKRRGG